MKEALSVVLLVLFLISCDTNTKINERTVDLTELMERAENGDDSTQFTLGFKYYFGDQGLPLNRDSARYWLDRAAKNGHEIAQKTYIGLFEIIPSSEGDTVK